MKIAALKKALPWAAAGGALLAIAALFGTRFPTSPQKTADLREKKESLEKIFPAAEDFLAQNGVDPAVALQLGGPAVRIVPRDKFRLYRDRLRETGKEGEASANELEYYMMDRFNAAAADKENNVRYFLPELKEDANCIVFAPDPAASAAEWISKTTYIGPSHIENTPASDQERFFLTLFHEIRHCHPDNTRHRFPEGDADYRAGEAVIKLFKNPSIRNYQLFSRAGPTPSEKHDISLYLDFLYNAPPRTQGFPDIGAAAGKARMYAAPALKDMPLFSMNLSHLDEGSPPPFLKIVDAYERVLNDPVEKIPDIARKRLRLYIDAVRYFAPAAMEKRNNAPAPRPSS